VNISYFILSTPLGSTITQRKVIKELSERAHIPHAPHIDRSNAKFLK
jgi:hypothetical protein